MSNTTVKDLRLSRSAATMAPEPEFVTPTLHHEISHGESKISVTIEIPGVDPETVDVHCEDNCLLVSCSKGTATVPFDPTTDVSKISADIQWGLLTVTIPAPAAPPSRAIKINLHDTVKKTEHTQKPVSKTPAKELTTAS
jgi:HSP20 family molecular chaperone IbpA